MERFCQKSAIDFVTSVLEEINDQEALHLIQVKLLPIAKSDKEMMEGNLEKTLLEKERYTNSFTYLRFP